MDSATIRGAFLDFFAERGHKIVPSSSLVPDDPTLLLTNAGMVQFKPYFLGEKARAFPRAASVQKCFREIDLEEVGKTNRHLTFFEMLGNFSFGDYFKREACSWGWELMIGPYGIPTDRLWVTVYEDDEEAAKIWEQEVGVPSSRILRRTRAEGNFWDMGVAGPCGPCSEILYDRGEAFGRPYVSGDLDEERYLEVWNLVFMQHYQDDKGEIVRDLPAQNVDTGMGLERLASILQAVPSNFEIDSMAPVLRQAQELTGLSYGASNETDVGLRVLVDHSRAMTFLVSDGVFPGNIGRGYVLRRLIRRAVRHARLMGVEDPVLADLTGTVVDTYASAYDEVGRNRELITKLVSKEEASFDQTLRSGLGMLENEIKRLRSQEQTHLSGEMVFKLHDTYGFPLDLTNDIAKDEGLEVDEPGFKDLMKAQRDRARSARGTGKQEGPGQQALSDIVDAAGRTEFLGYEELSLDTTIGGILQEEDAVEALAEGSVGQIVLAETPFYAEGGGQVGDRGDVRTTSGIFRVESTRWGIPGIIVHSGKVIEGDVVVGEQARATVDPNHRDGVTQSHSATHMIHWALRSTLGEHAKQQGSLVEPGRLRFDFSHFEPVNSDQLAQMEEEVNRRVLWDDSVRAFETTFDYATSIGAMALFGEKYGEHVRVVEVGDYSKELCGGTHVSHTGQIGVIKFVHEGSVAAGVRRVEALTGLAGLSHLNARVTELERIAQMLKTDPESAAERVEKILESLKGMESEISHLNDQRNRQEVESMLSSAIPAAPGGARLVLLERKGAPEDLRKLAVGLTQKMGSGVVVLGSTEGGKASLVAAVSKDLVDKGISAPSLLKEGKVALGGGGGGKPDLAVAGGPKIAEMARALKLCEAAARRALESLT
ncbi:MAG: alanine--tRNA ligase [Actinomycetota bacterium]